MSIPLKGNGEGGVAQSSIVRGKEKSHKKTEEERLKKEYRQEKQKVENGRKQSNIQGGHRKKSLFQKGGRTRKTRKVEQKGEGHSRRGI